MFRGKSLWSELAHTFLAVVIALECFSIFFMVVYLTPKFHKLMSDGIIDYTIIEEQGVGWMVAFLKLLDHWTDRYTTFILLGFVGLWSLFEWRVKSENKTLMRLSGLGSVAAGLMVVVGLTTGIMIILFCLTTPQLSKMAKPFAREQVALFDKSAQRFEAAQAQPDWSVLTEQAGQMSKVLAQLSRGPALGSIAGWRDRFPLADLRKHLKETRENLKVVQLRIFQQDAKGVDAALKETLKSFLWISLAAKQAPE